MRPDGPDGPATNSADGDGTGAGVPGGHDPAERAREGLEHLQSAARELIAAARAMLDVAEDLVNDPEAVASVAGTVGALGDLVRQRRPAATKPDADDDESDVERITIQ
jgi:hypothetical protein